MFYRHNKITAAQVWLWVLLFIAMVILAAASQAQSGTLSDTQAGARSKPAVKKQAQQIIDISSKTLLLDENKGISEYKGNVLFKQNTLRISADTISLYYKDNKLVKALITGSPADVEQHPDNEAKVHSQAEKMEYYVDENRLVLTGNAFVTQGSRHFSGKHIVYDTRQGTLTADSKSDSKETLNSTKSTQPNERVHVIIGPTENDKVIPNE